MINADVVFGPLPRSGPTPGTQTPLVERADAGEPEPYGVHTVTAPSGIEIYFQAGPKRLYRLREVIAGGGISDWREVPSVSDVKDILSKQLTYWGFRGGIASAATLLQDPATNGEALAWLLDEDPEEIMAKKALGFYNLARKHQLDPNSRKNKAGNRGTSVHKALEVWAEHNDIPDPDDFPETEQGYVQGLAMFLQDSRIQPVRSEVMVGSLEHGYAGRYDLDAYSVGNEVCVHLTEKGKGDRRAVIEPGLLRLDLKTTAGVFQEHYIQLAAYEQAAVECGHEKSDDRVVVNVWPDGRYQAKVSPAKFEHFKCCLDLYKALQELK